jgi:hypothetical protein
LISNINLFFLARLLHPHLRLAAVLRRTMGAVALALALALARGGVVEMGGGGD